MVSSIPPVDDLKAQAKRLRHDLCERGQAVSHSAALELIAHQYGLRDWNTLHARADEPAPDFPVSVGERVTGRYLGQPFQGQVIAFGMMGKKDLFRVTIVFDDAVDVVTSAHFSAMRKRVTAVIGQNRRSLKKTSDGEPHLLLDH